ncbi:MAG: membrane integrity-associated transporter subunit PqiC [Desulfovibrio sp.]|nr:membrane integrity-associated transporter subunit PqiC [Desulfovibrio sp.]
MRRTIPLLLLLCLLAACGRSTPTNYYLLESSLGLVAAQGLPRTSLRLAPVSLPAYLDRTGIVSRVEGQNRLIIAEFHAWAEPLGQGIARVLQAGLSPSLLTSGIDVLPVDADGGGDYVLLVEIQRLDGKLAGTAVLEARWTLQDRSGMILGRGIHTAQEPITGNAAPASEAEATQSYDLLVQAQSRLVRDMAIALAPRLTPLMKE